MVDEMIPIEEEAARIKRLANRAAAREVRMVAKLERVAARTVARERRLFERIS